MIIKRGITSFFNCNNRGAIPEFTLAEFKRIVYTVASNLRLDMSTIIERSVTPNFHRAQLDGSDISILMLGHSTYPLIAFAEPTDQNVCQLRFVDCTRIAKELQNLFPGVTIADSGELTRKVTETDIERLDDVERKQIQYWKPTTVGEVAFNWWD